MWGTIVFTTGLNIGAAGLVQSAGIASWQRCGPASSCRLCKLCTECSNVSHVEQQQCCSRQQASRRRRLSS